jgi:hypothetical protein
MGWTRLCLRDRDSRGQLNIVAADEQWFMDQVVQATDENPFEIVWVAPDHDATISYIEDEVINLDLALIRGDDHAEVADIVREKVATVAREDALDFARGSDDPVKAAYIVAATGSSEFDSDAYEVLERIAGSEDATARRAAIVAVAYLEWPEFRALIERLAEDPDEIVRSTARPMLDS